MPGMRRLRNVAGGAEELRPDLLIRTRIDSLPTPRTEAHKLVLAIQHGVSVEEIQTLIDVAPEQRAYLYTVTEGDPLRRRVVDHMLAFRLAVRNALDAELRKLQIRQV